MICVCYKLLSLAQIRCLVLLIAADLAVSSFSNVYRDCMMVLHDSLLVVHTQPNRSPVKTSVQKHFAVSCIICDRNHRIYFILLICLIWHHSAILQKKS